MVMDKIEKISKVKNAAKQVALPATEEIARLAPNKEHFDKLMSENGKKVPVETTIDAAKTGTSPIEVQRNISNSITTGKITPPELLTEIDKTVKKYDEARSKLKVGDNQVRDSAVPLLKDKLTNIDEGVRVALTKAGLEYKESFGQDSSGNPILRFMGMLTHGQYQLQNLAQEVERWHLNKTEIDPAAMLSIQIKVGYIQQELEFFTGLLNKALESTKTIMNVQV